MATDEERNANTTAARHAIKSLAADESKWIGFANNYVGNAQSAASKALRVSWWNVAEAAWKSARIAASNIAQWYQLAAASGDAYWPMSNQWDPRWVETGVVAASRASTYAQQQATAAASKAAAQEEPAPPQPPQNLPGPIQGPGPFQPTNPPVISPPDNPQVGPVNPPLFVPPPSAPPADPPLDNPGDPEAPPADPGAALLVVGVAAGLGYALWRLLTGGRGGR